MVMADVGLAARWYVVRTKSRQERRAESNLRAWGIETLLPWLSEPRHTLTVHVTPLFPTYLFARFDASVLLSKVRLTRGVRGVVGFGEYATPVDDEVVAFVRGRIQDDGYVHLRDPHPGEFVQVADGPLRSLVGLFEREVSGRGRVILLLSTIGGHARLHVAKASIRPTSEQSVA
jgi:transcriptional antiterminator RfaH